MHYYCVPIRCTSKYCGFRYGQPLCGFRYGQPLVDFFHLINFFVTLIVKMHDQSAEPTHPRCNFIIQYFCLIQFSSMSVVVALDSHHGRITLCTVWQESRLIVPFFKSITSIHFLLVCIVLSLFNQSVCNLIKVPLKNYKFSNNFLLKNHKFQ